MAVQTEELSMPDILKDIGIIESRLNELGLPAESVEKIMSMLNEYGELKDALIAARSKQFHDAAYDFAVNQKIATGKVTVALSAFLRQFAEHVIQEAAAYLQIDIKDIKTVVDHIPDLEEKTEE